MNIDFTEEELTFLVKALVQNYADDKSDMDKDHESMSQRMLMKIFMSADINTAWSEARSSQYNDKPSTNGCVFMGSPDAIGNMNMIHRRLAYAFMMSSGMQQNGGMGTDFDDEWDTKAKDALASVVKDVMTALGVSMDDLRMQNLKVFK